MKKMQYFNQENPDFSALERHAELAARELFVVH